HSPPAPATRPGALRVESAAASSGHPWLSWLWISSALSRTALSSVVAPERNRHPARLDVQFSRHIRFVEHATEHQLAGQRLALDEALKRRHGRHDIRRAGHAQLDAGR